MLVEKTSRVHAAYVFLYLRGIQYSRNLVQLFAYLTEFPAQIQCSYADPITAHAVFVIRNKLFIGLCIQEHSEHRTICTIATFTDMPVYSGFRIPPCLFILHVGENLVQVCGMNRLLTVRILRQCMRIVLSVC